MVDISAGPDHGQPDSDAGDRHHSGQHPDHAPRHPLPQADRHLALRGHEHDGNALLWLVSVTLATHLIGQVYLLVYHTFLEYITKKEANKDYSLKDVFFTKSRRNSKWGDIPGSTTR